MNARGLRTEMGEGLQPSGSAVAVAGTPDLDPGCVNPLLQHGG